MIIPSMDPMQLSQFKHAVTRTIGEQLRLLRRNKGLTGRDFGALLDLSQQQISRYERGNNYITTDTLLLMLSCLGVPPESFFRHLTLHLKNQGLVILSPYSFYDQDSLSVHSTYRLSMDS